MRFGRKDPQNQPQPRQRPKTTLRARQYFYASNERNGSETPQRSTNWLHNLPAYVASLVIVCSLLYSLYLQPRPRVVVINDQNTSVQPFLRPAEAYRDIAEKHLRGSLLNRSKLTVDTDELASKIQSETPEATDISITVPILGRSPVVYIRVAEPVFVMTAVDESFLIDEKGRAVIATKELSDQTILEDTLVVEDQSSLQFSAGQQALPREHVQFIRDAQYLLGQKGKRVSKMVLPPLINELHIFPAGQKYFVKLNLLLDVREQIGKYLAVDKQLLRENKAPNRYVDVRVEERSYVR